MKKLYNILLGLIMISSAAGIAINLFESTQGFAASLIFLMGSYWLWHKNNK